MEVIEPILLLVDQIILTYVIDVFNNLNPTLRTIFRLFFILFVALFGYRMAISGSVNPADLFTNTAKIILIFAIALLWDNFAVLFFNLFTLVPNELAGAVLGGGQSTINGNATASDAVTANSALGVFWDQGFEAAGNVLNDAKLTKIGLYFYGGLIILITVLVSGAALVLIVLAKLAVAILLAIGPIFIILLMFDSTRGFFEGWIRALINYAIIPVFTYALLALILRVIDGPTEALVRASPAGTGAFLGFLGTFILVGVIGTILLSQVPNMAASVTGGFALQTQNFARRLANRGSRAGREALRGIGDRFRGGGRTRDNAPVPRPRPQPRTDNTAPNVNTNNGTATGGVQRQGSS